MYDKTVCGYTHIRNVLKAPRNKSAVSKLRVTSGNGN
jgi:hypothetical protein